MPTEYCLELGQWVQDLVARRFRIGRLRAVKCQVEWHPNVHSPQLVRRWWSHDSRLWHVPQPDQWNQQENQVQDARRVPADAGRPGSRHRYLRRRTFAQEWSHRSVESHEQDFDQAANHSDWNTASEQSDGVPLHGPVRQTQPAGYQTRVYQPIRKSNQERTSRRLDRLRCTHHETTRSRPAQNARR